MRARPNGLVSWNSADLDLARASRRRDETVGLAPSRTSGPRSPLGPGAGLTDHDIVLARSW
jgi:hypothetical protein